LIQGIVLDFHVGCVGVLRFVVLMLSYEASVQVTFFSYRYLLSLFQTMYTDHGRIS